jgi:hypothetical protein
LEDCDASDRSSPGVSDAIRGGIGVVIGPFFMAQGKGGGKTGRKASKDTVENGRRLIEEARRKIKELSSKPNKKPADREAVERAERELKRLLDKVRKSEEHARAGQGY